MSELDSSNKEKPYVFSLFKCKFIFEILLCIQQLNYTVIGGFIITPKLNNKNNTYSLIKIWELLLLISLCCLSWLVWIVIIDIPSFWWS